MNTTKLRLGVLIILGIILLTVSGYALYMRSGNQKLAQELSDLKKNLDKTSQETIAINGNYVKLQNEYAKLKKDFENISSDRESLLTQSKGLLVDRNLARELEEKVIRLNKDIEALGLEKRELIDKNLAVSGEKNDLEVIQKQLIREKEQLKDTLETERAKSGAKRAEQEIASLKKENEAVSVKMKEYLAEVDRLKTNEFKLKETVRQLTDKAASLEKKLAGVVDANKRLEKKVTDDPVKFTELARQNKSLIKETAQMHYNLGVFYTNQKEYNRALSEFLKATELVPDDGAAHFNLGYIYAEYIVSRQKAIEHFRQYLRYAKKDDKDVDWVKKYIVTWQAFEGQQPLE